MKKPRFKEFALRTLLNQLDFRLLGFKERGYLFDIGWFKTGNGLHVDENGEYIPQFSYPFLEILKTRINTEMNVLEFGIGFSSIYFAKRCKSFAKSQRIAERPFHFLCDRDSSSRFAILKQCSNEPRAKNPWVSVDKRGLQRSDTTNSQSFPPSNKNRAEVKGSRTKKKER